MVKIKHVPLEELEDYEREGWWHNGWLSMKNGTAVVVKDDSQKDNLQPR